MLSKITFDFGTDTGGLPGNPVFENPYQEEDPRSQLLAPYFLSLKHFGELAEEYPTLSAKWSADLARWSVWPMPFGRTGEVEGVPTAPGGELHVHRSATEAAETLLGFSTEDRQQAVRKWLSLYRDPWLNIEQLEAWEFWLHTIREFWLDAREEAQATGADLGRFEQLAKAYGYRHGRLTPIGARIWSTMRSQRKSLSTVRAEQHVEIPGDIGPGEQVEWWIGSGNICHVFRCSAYFCGVLLARRVQELQAPKASDGAVRDQRDARINRQAPICHFKYDDDFPDAEQIAIEDARLEANMEFERQTFQTYHEYREGRVVWFWKVVSAAAAAIGRAGATQGWGAHRRREMLRDFGFRAAEAAGLAGKQGFLYERTLESHQWHVLEEGLFSEPIAERETVAQPAGASNAPGEKLDDANRAIPKKRGRRPNQQRREAIHNAIMKQGPDWRDHLEEIFSELDEKNVKLGDLETMEIDLGDGLMERPAKWADLDLAEGQQRKQLINTLGKYVD